MSKLFLAFANLALFVVFAYAEIPSYIKICGRRNPNIDECILNSIKELRPKVHDGIPELQVPSVEPLKIEKIDLIDQANFRASATNVLITGISNYTVNFLHIDLSQQKIEMDLQFPKISFTAEYDVQAKILVPISGKGPISMESENVNAKVTMKYKFIERRGKEYIFFQSMTTKLTLLDYTAKFMATDGPESTLTTAINDVLKNSRQELIEGTTPNLEKVISEMVLRIANTIGKHFTHDELFPDRE